jgi:hypothetical protein
LLALRARSPQVYGPRFLIFKIALVVVGLGALTLTVFELEHRVVRLPPASGIVIGHCPGGCAVKPLLQLDLADANSGWTAWQQPGARLHLYRIGGDGRPRGRGWQLPDKRAAQLGHDGAGALIAWRVRRGKRFHLEMAPVGAGRLGTATRITGDDVLASRSPLADDDGPQIEQLVWDPKQRQLLVVEAGIVPWAGTKQRPCRPYVLVTALRGRRLVARQRIDLGPRQSFVLPRAALAITGDGYLLDLVRPGDNENGAPQPDVLLERPLDKGLTPLAGWRKFSQSPRGGGLRDPVAFQTTHGVWRAWTAGSADSLAASALLTVWVEPPGRAPRPVARFVAATDHPSGLAFTAADDHLSLSWSDGAHFVVVRLAGDGHILGGRRWLGIGAAAGGAGPARKLLLALDLRGGLRLLRLRGQP